MRLPITIVLISILSIQVYSQEISRDSLLSEVVVQAYAANRGITSVPASIARISTEDLQRFSNRSLLQGMNTLPGVRMEERSPGSYRFSIRGSSLRSPFGVRNVKVYWNGLPFTDAGGNTYINLLDPEMIGAAEVIKGPAGSLYGAGTGGVVLISDPLIKDDALSFSSTLGSYGLQRYALGGQAAGEVINVRVQGVHHQADNYREQSAFRRTSGNGSLTVRLNNKHFLTANLLYTDLSYETPGGLTEAQFNEDPAQARPPTATVRGAVEQRAEVFNKTFFGGLTHGVDWSADLSTQTSVYASSVDFENPTIRNYEIRDEKNVGGRTVTRYEKNSNSYVNVIAGGAEFQLMTSPIDVYSNDAGEKGTFVFSRDNLRSNLALLFLQNDFTWKNNLNIVFGLSVNFSGIAFERTEPQAVKETVTFDPQVLPRLALLYKLSSKVSAFAGYSRGFSPPTIAELYPSRSIFDKNLAPEAGNNFELGVRANAFSNKLFLEVVGYQFNLKNTIVIRRDASMPGEPEYFVNAGSTTQRGLEVSARHSLYQSNGFLSGATLRGSYAYNHFRFDEYTQGSDDFSGNKLTGVPPTTAFAGLDLAFLNAFLLTVSANYVDHVPLNDANSAFASDYTLVALRASYAARKNALGLELFAGVDNLLDERYSLGNDLNAVGGRYYNTAAPRSYYAGIRLNIGAARPD